MAATMRGRARARPQGFRGVLLVPRGTCAYHRSAAGDAGHVEEGLLRSERSGKGSGRVYTITYSATDASGHTTVRQATVTVPH